MADDHYSIFPICCSNWCSVDVACSMVFQHVRQFRVKSILGWMSAWQSTGSSCIDNRARGSFAEYLMVLTTQNFVKIKPLVLAGLCTQFPLALVWKCDSGCGQRSRSGRRSRGVWKIVQLKLWDRLVKKHARVHAGEIKI